MASLRTTFDFDDTHLKTIIRPLLAGGVRAVLEAIEHNSQQRLDVIDALVIGIDVSLSSVGNATYPDSLRRGWHITGSTGTKGAAAACARLLKLTCRKTMALALPLIVHWHARAVRRPHDRYYLGGARRWSMSFRWPAIITPPARKRCRPHAADADPISTKKHLGGNHR
jgi:hypothetical protein